MDFKADEARVAESIRAAEIRTAGEIFCVVAHASSSYRLVPVAWAAMIAMLTPLLLIYLTSLPAGTIYMLQLAAFTIAVTVLSIPVIRYRIVPKQAMRRRAHAEAM